MITATWSATTYLPQHLQDITSIPTRQNLWSQKYSFFAVLSLHKEVTDRIPVLEPLMLLLNKRSTFSSRKINIVLIFLKQKKIWLNKSNSAVSGAAQFLHKLPQAGVSVKPVQDQTHLLTIIISFLFIHQCMNGYNRAIKTKGFRGNVWQSKKLHQPHTPLFKELWTLIAAKEEAAATPN